MDQNHNKNDSSIYFEKNPVRMSLPYSTFSMPAVCIDTYLLFQYFVCNQKTQIMHKI